MEEGMAMIRQNLHTHTKYCDGANTPEEMIEAAIEQGFTILGFSGHGHAEVDDVSMTLANQATYIEHINRLKGQFPLDIYLGLEQDLFGPVQNQSDFDYLIGSVHYIQYQNQYYCIDMSSQQTQANIQDFGSAIDYACCYYEHVRQLKNVDIIGHFDLVTKFNDLTPLIDTQDRRYIQAACDTIDALANLVFEVNTGAIARGLRKGPYPSEALLRYMKEKGVQLVLNSDCHRKERLAAAYPETLALLKKCGYQSLMKKTATGFVAERIDQFQ